MSDAPFCYIIIHCCPIFFAHLPYYINVFIKNVWRNEKKNLTLPLVDIICILPFSVKLTTNQLTK